jgi:predicted DNA binding protein
MPETVSEKLNRLLDLVVDNIRKDKEVAEYPDIASLEAYVVRKVVCRKNYQCSLCKVHRRNKCWRKAQAYERRIELRKMIINKELDKEKLSSMKMSELFVVASLLGLRYRFGAKITKNSLVANILKKINQ